MDFGTAGRARYSARRRDALPMNQMLSRVRKPHPRNSPPAQCTDFFSPHAFDDSIDVAQVGDAHVNPEARNQQPRWQSMARSPAPPAALRTKGIPSRIHMPAHMAADIARLLNLGKAHWQPSDGLQADELAVTISELLVPHCGYGYSYQHNDGCSITVSEPGEACSEHTEWPLPNTIDPDPARCPGVPIQENETQTWVAAGATVRLFGNELNTADSGALVSTRCPYPRRSDGSPCALHAQLPEDRCGWAATTDTEPCQEITALYGCPKHYAKRLAQDTEKIRLSVPCTYCGAEPSRSCKGRTASYNDHVHSARKTKTDRQTEALRVSMPSPPTQRAKWLMATPAKLNS